ncbi:conserved protein of unknown function [Rhodovastum atsumiense]|uniref:Uncharacterized protein n=1 Tax=Rhodovastum atsumiense TaxID=504468 RepID=A0A5M6IUU4_9PROT|nr:hypothetical protein [Rhodovastum atsumiense]KAA5612070.1 hypothetical protein F1189_11470 [Rhodovastum atsumiense]CAH2604059.1 conserved protein of unknown function [Rhodovastum atsumiense]
MNVWMVGCSGPRACTLLDRIAAFETGLARQAARWRVEDDAAMLAMEEEILSAGEEEASASSRPRTSSARSILGTLGIAASLVLMWLGMQVI